MDKTTTIKELYRTFRERDYAAFLNLCTEDIVWVQNPGFPDGQTHLGAQAVVDRVFKTIDTQWSEFTFTIAEILEADDRVLVVGSYKGAHRVTGKSFLASAAHLYDFRENRVCRFRQFTDTHLIHEAISESRI